jgi:HEAT repeat protein
MIGAKMPPDETPTLIPELVHRIRSTDSYQDAVEMSMRLVELGSACIPELLNELSGLHNKEWKKSLQERDWLRLQVLGDIGSASVIPTLEEALKHMIPSGNQPEQIVYWQLVWTLVQCGSFSHFQHALDVFCYDEHVMSSVGHYVLVSLGEKILPRLIDVFEKPDETARLSITRRREKLERHIEETELQQKIPDGLKEYWRLQLNLEKAIAWLKASIVISLGDIGDKRAVPCLIEALQEPVGWLTTNIVIALGKVGDESAIPHLIDVLRRSSKGLTQNYAHVAAAKALSQFEVITQSTDIADELLAVAKEFSNHKETTLRTWAIEIMGNLGGDAVVQLLADMLNDDEALNILTDPRGVTWERGCWASRPVYEYAVEALGQIGTPVARAALAQWLAARD